MPNARALIIEQEYLIALDIENTLAAAGFSDIVSLHGVAEVATDIDSLDLAVIEAHLGAPDVIAFAAALRARGVPVVVTSADIAAMALFPGAVPLPKPFNAPALLAACVLARQGAADYVNRGDDVTCADTASGP